METFYVTKVSVIKFILILEYPEQIEQVTFVT